jgi:serine protease Do
MRVNLAFMKLIRPILLLVLIFQLGRPLARADETSISQDLEVTRQLNRSFVAIADKVSASVVIINVEQKVTPVLEDFDDEDRSDSKPPGFWKRFHEQFRHPPVEKTIGQGSGIIIREDGYILTNGHVIEDAEKVSVRLQDGKIYKASVRGVDPQSDVAVIKIDAHGLPVAKLGNSGKTRVGEFAIAIGAPFGFDYSVTFGHVSAKGRSNIIDGPEGRSMDQDFIQTDALINPGNSGGPLVNIEGEVIGINTLIQGLHSGIGFAVPSNLAQEVSDQIIERGKFTRPYLGIGMNALREESDFRELLTGVQEGVLVRTVMSDGPAHGYIKAGDIITAVDGEAVATPQQLRGAIRGKKIGEPITLKIYREGKTIPVRVSPSEWPEPPVEVTAVKPVPSSKAAPAGLGITVKPLTASMASQLGSAATEGVVIATIDKNSPAARAGLKPGEIITAINQQSIGNGKQFQAAMEKADLTKGVLVTLLNGNTARFEILKAAP